MKNNLLVYILLCLLNLSWANARNKQQEAEALIKKSVEALYNNPKQASYYAAKVIELFPEERQNDQKAEAMFYYSQAEKLLGNFDVSIKIYMTHWSMQLLPIKSWMDKFTHW